MAMDTSSLVKLLAEAAQKADAAGLQRYVSLLRDRLEGTGAPLESADAYRLVDALSRSGAFERIVTATGPSPYKIIASIDAAAQKRPPDRTAIAEACNTLYDLLANPHVQFMNEPAEQLLSRLRGARSFEQMGRIADRLMTRGQDTASVRRLYAQALIEEGHLQSAIHILNSILNMPGAPSVERFQATGLLGRVYKQIYVNHVRSSGDAYVLRAQFGPYLDKAIKTYATAVDTAPPQERRWMNINLVALLKRAERDGIPRPDAISANAIAQRLISELAQEAETSSDPWAAGTIAEAHLALGNLKEAARYFAIFAKRADDFQLAGTVRQLEQVWGIEAGSEGAGPILAGLKAALSRRDSGDLVLSAAERQNLANPLTPAGQALLETMTENGQYYKLDILQKIVRRASAVAIIRKPDLSGHGTGFLVNGSEFGLNDGETYVLTNAHVIRDPSKDPEPGLNAIRPEEARVCFESEIAEGGDLKTYTCEPTVVFCSPSTELDATLIKLTTRITHLKPIPLATTKVSLTPENEARGMKGTRLAIIGHPKGGSLALSVMGDIRDTNGTLVDMGPKTKDGKEPVYLHYRTPSEGGNSGSPVFETDSWNLVALHHAGFPAGGRPLLSGKPGKHEANEGISIESIRRYANEKPKKRRFL